MVKYKIVAFDRRSGYITINYEGFMSMNFKAPHIGDQYISEEDFDLWAQTNFYQHYHLWDMEIDPSTIKGFEWIESKIDGTPFDVTHDPHKPLIPHGSEVEIELPYTFEQMVSSMANNTPLNIDPTNVKVIDPTT